MNEFVDECRSEWRRLGVSDAVADEMAAELAADLEEAEAEGVSAEEALGSGALDPRLFATAWAAERGLIRRPLPSVAGVPRRSRMLAAVGAFALIAITGAVLVVLASPSAPRRLTLASPVDPPPRVFVRALSPDGTRIVVAPDVNDVLPLPPGARIVAVDMNDSGVDTRTVGSVLLTVGLAGVVPLTMLWLSAGPGRWSRRRTSGVES